MLATAVFENETEETVSCDECGKENLDAYDAEFSAYHGWQVSGNYCDDCRPVCYGPCCGEPYED